jgi:Rrf2 family protein
VASQPNADGACIHLFFWRLKQTKHHFTSMTLSNALGSKQGVVGQAMKMPRTITYALAAVLELSSDTSGCPLSAGTICERRGMPSRFLPQILRALVKRGIVISKPGVAGGYFLARAPDKIRVLDVMDSFEDGFAYRLDNAITIDGAATDTLDVKLQEARLAARACLAEFTISELVSVEPSIKS